jgi:hypothetical protein
MNRWSHALAPWRPRASDSSISEVLKLAKVPRMPALVQMVSKRQTPIAPGYQHSLRVYKELLRAQVG